MAKKGNRALNFRVDSHSRQNHVFISITGVQYDMICKSNLKCLQKKEKKSQNLKKGRKEKRKKENISESQKKRKKQITGNLPSPCWAFEMRISSKSPVHDLKGP